MIPLDAENLGTVSIRRWYPAFAFLAGIYLVILGWHHWNQLGISLWRIPVIILSFAWLVLLITAAHLNRPVKIGISKKRIVAIIPSHNEDPAMLSAMLQSLDRQTVKPDAVYFIENGGTDGNAERIVNEWRQETTIRDVHFDYREEPSKRGAQGLAFEKETDTNAIVVTVDGDTRLDPRAIENGIRPFADPEVTSVAGLLVGLNRNKNLLTRIVDISFVASFMNGRAAWSRFNSVAVNCGGLAFYRLWVIKKHLYDYLNQTVAGRKVESGDDRMLTAFAALEGKTVFQETSVGYTLLPENISHLTRQRGRWWRSFWWGGIWLIRRFSPRRAIWWLVMSQYITFTLYAVMFPLILVVDPIVNQKFPWFFFVYIAGLSYVRCARTLAVRRPDQSFVSQFFGFLVFAPLSTFLNIWLCTILQWWGMFTFRTTGWRTRQQVEVGIG